MGPGFVYGSKHYQLSYIASLVFVIIIFLGFTLLFFICVYMCVPKSIYVHQMNAGPHEGQTEARLH